LLPLYFQHPFNDRYILFNMKQILYQKTKNKKQKTKKSIFYKLNIPSIMKFYRFYFLFFYYGWNLKIIKISKKNYLIIYYYRLYIYRKYYRTTLVLTIVYYPTYINIDRKSWLVNRLSLLLLFNSYTISSLVSFIFYIFITNGISKSFFQRLKLLKKLFTNIIYFLVMNR